MRNGSIDLTEMANSDTQRVLAEILNRLKALDDRVSAIERRRRYSRSRVSALQSIEVDPHTKSQQRETDLRHVLARHVNSIVGLEEALVWAYKPVRYIWVFILFLSTVGTVFYLYTTTAEFLHDPTATTVKLESSKNYSYPYMVLCPPAWLDAQKAFSIGLTEAALEYSLGFFDEIVKQFQNASIGKLEFERFFAAGNFRTLTDYFTALSVDVFIDGSTDEHDANLNRSSAFCDGCNPQVYARKVFTSPQGVCYAFQFQPEDSKRRGWATWSSTRSIAMKVLDSDREIFSHGDNWQLYMLPDLQMVQPSSLFITLQASSFNLIKLNTQRIDSLPHHSDRCKPNDEFSKDGNYSPDICMVECMNRNAKREYDCKFLSWTTSNQEATTNSSETNSTRDHPSEYCNSFDPQITPLSGGNASMTNVKRRMNWIEQTYMPECFDECPYGCERTIYDSTFVSHGPVSEKFYPIVKMARDLNLSFVELAFTNAALYQGGVLTIREYSTFSFSTLVSNVGGTLGLFTGCTILTLVQLLFSLISYFCLSGKGMIEDE